jgi:predicted RNA methylase
MTNAIVEPALRDRLAEDLVEALRSGVAVSDAQFDVFYPRAVRIMSSQFWTPVAVALRAAQLLAPKRSTRVLDVGSGVGKLCIIGSLLTGASFTGVEQRPHLTEVARDCAENLQATRAQFVDARLEQVSWDAFDAFYFFNPFGENLFSAPDRLDNTVELSATRHVADVERVEDLLSNARAGTRVVTYHGFGGVMPDGYRLELEEQWRTDALKLWVKS